MSFELKQTNRKVGDLLNDETVVIVYTGTTHKYAETTKVKYGLADFMEDEPPFIEVYFLDGEDECVYLTEDLSEPVYELDGLLIVKGK